MTTTYVDAGLLIAIFRGDRPLARRAIEVVDDPDRRFVASRFLRLELIPKAVYHRQRAEVAYDEGFFARVVAWAEPLDRVVAEAEREAARLGLNALDALHVAAAALLGADELVTTEGPTKPIHRATGVQVVTIHPVVAR